MLLQFNEIFSFTATPVRLKTSMKLLAKVWNLTRLKTKITNSPKDCLHPLVHIHQRLPGKHFSKNSDRKKQMSLEFFVNASRIIEEFQKIALVLSVLASFHQPFPGTYFIESFENS